MLNYSVLKVGTDNKGNVVQLFKNNQGEYGVKHWTDREVVLYDCLSSRLADNKFNQLTADKAVPYIVMRRVREMLDIDENDNSQDDKIISQYTNKELFDMYLRYEGIIGYTDTLINIVEGLYNVDLES